MWCAPSAAPEHIYARAQEGQGPSSWRRTRSGRQMMGPCPGWAWAAFRMTWARRRREYPQEDAAPPSQGPGGRLPTLVEPALQAEPITGLEAPLRPSRAWLGSCKAHKARGTRAEGHRQGTCLGRMSRVGMNGLGLAVGAPSHNSLSQLTGRFPDRSLTLSPGGLTPGWSHHFISGPGTGPSHSRCSVNTTRQICSFHKCPDWSLEILPEETRTFCEGW